ncbi:MAG: hypothetical protein LUQ64_02935 [Methanomicrobiales archaeon]|nr:hypothetical protein [Methanomicrobiales archaeon]
MQEQEQGEVKEVSVNNRYYIAQLIRNYLVQQQVTHMDATARDIVNVLHLPNGYVFSVSGFLNFLYRNQMSRSRYGFSIVRSQAYRKSGYPHRYTIELVE